MIKYAVKQLVAHARSLFLFLSGAKTNTEGWGGRILIINLQALGDMVMFTGVLKHYKKRFPDKKLYLLAKSGMGIERSFQGAFVDEVITVDYRKFSGDPFYGAGIIRQVRGIGFHTVIDHDFSAADVNGRSLAVSAGAKEVIGYEGMQFERDNPFDVHQRQNLTHVQKKLLPKYSRVIPAIDRNWKTATRLPHVLSHYVAIYEAVTGSREADYSTELPTSDGSALKRFGLERGKYAVMNVNASVAYKRWPPERFAEVAKFFGESDVPVVLVGSRGERDYTGQFAQRVKEGKIINAAGETSLEELISLIQNCLVVVTNDTSTVHLAVVLKKPSVTISGGGQFHMFCDYGYPDVNKVVYRRVAGCCENWNCKHAPLGAPSKCINAVSVDMVKVQLDALLAYLKNTPGYPREPFRF